MTFALLLMNFLFVQGPCSGCPSGPGPCAPCCTSPGGCGGGPPPPPGLDIDMYVYLAFAIALCYGAYRIQKLMNGRLAS